MEKGPWTVSSPPVCILLSKACPVLSSPQPGLDLDGRGLSPPGSLDLGTVDVLEWISPCRAVPCGAPSALPGLFPLDVTGIPSL